MKKLIITTITCIILSLSPMTYGLEKKYQIEILIFSDINSANAKSELWPATSNIPPFQPPNIPEIQILPNQEAQVTGDTVMLISPSQFIIKENAFKREKSQHILCHFGWIQDFSQQPNIQLALKRVPDNVAPTSIQGLISIGLKTYFNAQFTLLFSEPLGTFTHVSATQPLQNIINGNAYFLFDQTRRMRSKELNYLDHPLYGILIYILPLNN